MATILDSEAHFSARCSQIRITDASARELTRLGFKTVGQFAYAIGQPGQPLPEDEWRAWVGSHFGSANSGDVASLRRLLFECQTLMLADLRDQIANPSASAARPVPDAERERRLSALRVKLPGIIIEGDGEPSRHLLELACQMVALNELRYISPAKCTSRLAEIASAKPVQRVLELEQKALVLKDTSEPAEVSVHTPLQLVAAFKRRGLALHFADACDFVAHERYVSTLMAHLSRDPSVGTPPCNLAQIVEADRLVHVKMLELGVQPKRDASNVRALDTAMIKALDSYHVSFSLLPGQHVRPQPSGRRQRQKEKRKRQKEAAKKKNDDKRQKTDETKEDNKAKGGGKGVPAKIAQLGGKSATPDGKAICYNFNLHSCSASACPRLHVCCRCFGKHPILKCSQVKLHE